MNCFAHQSEPAIGICKACHKAVCARCAIDTGVGLACSSECENKVTELSMMVDRSKRIYNIGTASKMPPTVVVMFLFFGAIFSSVAVYQYVWKDRFDFIACAMGVGFFAFSIFSYVRNKKLNLNC
jgi:hypothetical protein